MRKTFPCGHTGKGQYCHRCHEKELEMAAKVALRFEKQERLRKAECITGVDLSGLPLNVSEKASDIINKIRGGVPYMQFKGKRMDSDRTLISIPVGYSHRMLCRDTDKGLCVLSVLSHEDYNKVYP
jgi:hypothetical protein